MELLAHLARHTTAERVLLVGVYRDVRVSPEHPLRRATRELGREQLLEEVGPTRLGREDTATLVGERLDAAVVTREISGPVYRHTQGNPFFTVEVSRDLIERNHLVRHEGELDPPRVRRSRGA